MKRSIVVSLGGNAILPAGKAGTIEEQFQITRETMSQVLDLIRHNRVVFTHGNGPVVGNILIRNDAAKDRIPAMPLDICGADSQGGLGYMIQQTLQNLLREAGVAREVATVITQVVVDRDDPGFQSPSKPIGPFYREKEAQALASEKGWKMVQDAGRGFRRVVPSPKPMRIVEMGTIRALYEKGYVVIAAGGGGIPVIEDSGGALRGVEAVIDKDLASVVLGRELGADCLIIVTEVDRVALDFNKPTQRDIETMTIEEAGRHLADGQFPPGSMGPKVEAAIWFLRTGGREVCITSPRRLKDALNGRGGTWIRSSSERVSAT
jgi:carbamate kinase